MGHKLSARTNSWSSALSFQVALEILDFRITTIVNLNITLCNTLLKSAMQALENRLADLGKAFEEATIDKMDQLAKTIEMEKSLQMAAELKQVENFSIPYLVMFLTQLPGLCIVYFIPVFRNWVDSTSNESLLKRCYIICDSSYNYNMLKNLNNTRVMMQDLIGTNILPVFAMWNKTQD